MANLQDVIERMKDEGQLTRNSGTNSIKQTNRILGEMNTNLVSIGKSLGAIRTVGGLGSGQAVQVVGGGGAGGGTAAAATAPVSNDSSDPQGVMGLLGAAIRNQTVGRAERGAAAAKEAAIAAFQSSSLGKGVAATQQFVGEKVEGTKEGLRGLAGIQTNKERDDLLRKSAEEEAETREEIEKLVEIQTAFLDLSEDEAQRLRQSKLREADLASGGGGTATPASAAVGAGAVGGGGAAGGGGAGGGTGKMGGTIGKFFGGIGGGVLAGFVAALGNPLLLKAAAIFAVVMPLIGVGLAGFIAALGLGFAAAAAIAGKGLEVLNEPLDKFSGVMGNFEKLNGEKIGQVGLGLGTFFSELPLIKIGATAVVLDKLDLDGFGKFADSMTVFEKTDGQKLSVAGTGIGNFFEGMPGLGGIASAAAAGKVAGSLMDFGNALKKFEDLNAEKLKEIGPAVKQLGEGLSEAAGGGFVGAIGSLASAALDFLGVKEKDPIEMFKRFAVLGEGEMGDSLKKAGEAVSSLGKGLSSVNEFSDLDMGNLEDFVDDILPPLTKLSSSFNSPEMAGDPLGKFTTGLSKLGELENVNGTAVQANLTNIGKGLSNFIEGVEDGKIDTLQKAGFVLSMILGKGGELRAPGGGGGGGGSLLSGFTRSADLEGGGSVDPLTGRPSRRSRRRDRLQAQADELKRRGVNKGTFIAGKFFDAEAGLTDEQAAMLKIKKRMGNELRPELADALSRYESGGGRTNGAAINGASREIAAGQRNNGGNVIAPTDNSNNSTNVTNVSHGGGSGPSPSPRRSQIRGGMYNRSEHF